MPGQPVRSGCLIGSLQTPVDPADQVAVSDVANEQIQRIGGLIEPAVAQPGSRQRAVGEVVGLGAGEPALVVPAVVKVPVASELRAAWPSAQGAFDHMPRREAVAVHKVLGDLVGNALVAQGRDEVIEQGRRIPVADSLPQVFPVGPETGLVDEGGGAGDVADLEDQPRGMGEGRIILCR